MKLSRLFNSLPKKLAATGLVALAVVLPVAASAADTVSFTAQTGVANVTAGDTTYSSSVSAKYNEVVKVQVSYNNNEAADSGKVANNVQIKINVPSAAGVNQTIATTVSGDNISTVNGSAKVTLDGSDAYLQYIPGTAEWVHTTTPNGTQTTETKLSDDIVMNANGVNLGDLNPCEPGAVAVEVGVMVPGVSVNKYVRADAGLNAWPATPATSMTANPGDTVQYVIAYKNTGNTVENNVVVRDNLPPQMTLVPGTSYIKNGDHPTWTALNDDDVASNGIVIGTYNPGAAAYVMFSVKVPAATQLSCGTHQLRNVGIVMPQGMNEYYNTADVNVTSSNGCTQPKSPTYSCDAFHVTVGDNRTVTIDQFTFTASDGSTLGAATLDWGDNSAAKVTNNIKGATHQYTADGTYKISLSDFKVNGQSVNVSGTCAQSVTISTPTTPTTPPSQLPNTGAGDVIGLVAGAVAAGTVASRLYIARKLSR